MKNKLRFIIAFFALLTFAGVLSAQDNEDIEKKSASKIERPQEAQRMIMPIDDAERVKRCPLQMQQTIIAGIIDNFATPTDPTYKTPAFLAVFAGIPFKDFDDKTNDRAVGQSFVLPKIKPCEGKVCTAQLEVRVCNNGTNVWKNDSLSVGTIQNGSLQAWAHSGYIWNAQTDKGKCKTITIPINVASLNNNPTLDVYIQDDTAVDYIKLTLNY